MCVTVKNSNKVSSLNCNEPCKNMVRMARRLQQIKWRIQGAKIERKETEERIKFNKEDDKDELANKKLENMSYHEKCRYKKYILKYNPDDETYLEIPQDRGVINHTWGNHSMGIIRARKF